MKKNIFIIAILILLLSINTISFAETNTLTYQENLDSNKHDNMNDDAYVLDTGLPDTTIDDVKDWADRKGFEIVGLLQKVAQPFSIIFFIGCAFMCLFGILGNGRLVSRGMVGMIIVLIIYASIISAPEILDIFLSWMRS